MAKLRVLSLSTLFPHPLRRAFGGFVARQMDAVVATGDIELVMLNPLGIPPWPLSARQPFRGLLSPPAQSQRDSGLVVYHPRFTAIPGRGDSNPRRLAKAVLPLARRLHSQQPFDVVDAQFFFPDGPAAATIARALGRPLAIKARGSDIHLWGRRPRAMAQIDLAGRQAAAILAVSEALKRDMIALGLPADRIAVHYTGVDRRRFRPHPRAAARSLVAGWRDLAIPIEGPLLLCVGALIPIKGQRLAIEALASIPDALLALVGAGPDEAGLRRLAERLGVAQRVRFLGQVDHERLPQLISAADVMVLPSEREGLANAWVESLGCGTPLVIPDVGGAREVVRDPGAGRLVDRNPKAIAAAVLELISRPPDQTEVAERSARFSWETNAAELIEAWHRAAGTPRPAAP